MTARLLPFRLGDVLLVAEASEEEGARVILHAPDDLYPLRAAIETQVLHDSAVLVDSLRNRRGRTFEGTTGYVFHDEAPDDVLRGHVRTFFRDDDFVLPEGDFAVAVLSVLLAAVEAGWGPETDLRDALRRHRRLPLHFAHPFRPRFAMTIRDDRGASDAPVARILSDGTSGRILLGDAALGPLLADVFSTPLLVLPAHIIGTGGPKADPVPHRLAPWSAEAFAHLAREGLRSHALTGRMEPTR